MTLEVEIGGINMFVRGYTSLSKDVKNILILS